jgi:hypothetical protein
MGSPRSVEPSGRSALERLDDVLAALLRQQASGGSPQSLTATRLCELPGISRNALYRYHPDVLHALHHAQRRQHRADRGSAKRAARQLRQDNDALREQVTKLAAPVDHYYAAWQESRTLLARRERELAEVRRSIKPQVTSIRN